MTKSISLQNPPSPQRPTLDQYCPDSLQQYYKHRIKEAGGSPTATVAARVLSAQAQTKS